MNNELKKIFIQLKDILKTLFFNQNNILSNKMNIYLKNSNNKVILLQFKQENIYHLLGMHYWIKLENTKHHQDSKLYLEKFINKVINGVYTFDNLNKKLINNFKKISNDFKNYKSDKVFNFLINRFFIFVTFIKGLQEKQFFNFEIYFNESKTLICLIVSGNKTNCSGYIEFEKISHDRYKYETYIPRSIKQIKNIYKKWESNYFDLRNISPNILVQKIV